MSVDSVRVYQGIWYTGHVILVARARTLPVQLDLGGLQLDISVHGKHIQARWTTSSVDWLPSHEHLCCKSY